MSTAYELALDPRIRKASGVYYTPPALAAALLERTLGPHLAGKSDIRSLRVLDPACGAGSLLAAAAERVPRESLFGVDIDARAVAAARRLGANVVRGDALALDWRRAFPEAFERANPGFDVVLANPPWGQKGTEISRARRRDLQARFPSSAGIFDIFRPFVELGVRLLREGGRFGMVLPDIVLLKDYPGTRLLLLDSLTLESLETWGLAFSSAKIDAVTITGRKERAPPEHCVRTRWGSIPQDDFRQNPRHVFNLELTPSKRAILARLVSLPVLGDFFEVHEGVHSGNLRREIFLDRRVDATCRPLLFGRDEIAPHRLRWNGRFLRLGAAKRSRHAYCNVGRSEWHEAKKVLVRRTGDRVVAAVDGKGRHASNNFFLVIPRRPCGLDLFGLAALLNSRFLTALFRTIEPRRGKIFAELKIKHLSRFPIPTRNTEQLNALGRRRVRDRSLDAEIDGAVLLALGLDELALQVLEEPLVSR